MKKHERLDETTAPDGTVLSLHRHDGAYAIHVGTVELMSTRRHHSEERFGELACAPLAGRSGARVLVGGLGLGFTLRAVLRTVAADARVVVAELVEGVIRWNREPAYGLAADALADPRVDLRHADVADVLRAARTHESRFDAILLDVDNGTDAITHAGNAALYRAGGIRLAMDALREGGRLAYWAAQEEPAFEMLLRKQGLAVEVERARAHASKGPRQHVLYLCRT